jgi:hypothetical protein
LRIGDTGVELGIIISVGRTVLVFLHAIAQRLVVVITGRTDLRVNNVFFIHRQLKLFVGNQAVGVDQAQRKLVGACCCRCTGNPEGGRAGDEFDSDVVRQIAVPEFTGGNLCAVICGRDFLGVGAINLGVFEELIGVEFRVANIGVVFSDITHPLVDLFFADDGGKDKTPGSLEFRDAEHQRFAVGRFFESESWRQ